MDKIKPLLGFIGVNAFFYICGSIVTWNFNINQWQPESRSFVTLLSFCLSISCAYAIISNNQNK